MGGAADVHECVWDMLLTREGALTLLINYEKTCVTGLWQHVVSVEYSLLVACSRLTNKCSSGPLDL